MASTNPHVSRFGLGADSKGVKSEMLVLMSVVVGIILLGKYGPFRVLKPLLQLGWYFLKGVFWVSVGMLLILIFLRAMLCTG